ncbi:CUB domain containing protein [Fasciola gigantica]|uniref:CUB domain containing protein n=1 Tax=Fasciola gigantica TaxID=46835 RepID=A0A504YL83_FASGI|nr:CUB domain containing protein [Fasciola gigantica]
MVGNVFVLWLLFGRLLGQLVSKMTYYLSRDCQIPLGRDTLHPYRDTAHLRVDALQGGLVIQSHNWWLPQINQTVPSSAANHSQHSVYPLNFSCEIVIHTPVENARIMLRIEEFYVPSASEDCVDNYLYVFDSNTAKSKAMPEAGGERGLCRASYPRFPIFTTKSAICIAFHTSAHLSPVPPNYRPGFRLILTTVHDTTTTACPQGLFYCGLRPHPSYVDSKQQQQQQQQLQPPPPVSYGHLGLAFGSSTPLKSTGSAVHSLSSASASNPGSVASSFVDRSNPAPLSTSVSSSRDLGRSALGYCIPERTVCDGIGNCADSRDESVAQCGESGSSE